MNNEYSSDTKKVAAKLAGMTDACANVYDDERLTELFALAPVDATYVSGDGEYFCIDADGDWISAGKNGGGVCVSMPYAPVLIPPYESELNRLTDDWDEDQWTGHNHYGWLEGRQLFTSNTPSSRLGRSTLVFTRDEWQARREQRIAAGLIDVNDTDEPYVTWAGVPDDLKWLAENVEECPCAYIKKTIGGHEAADMRNQFSSLGHYFTKAQWQRAREIYEAKEYCLKWDESDAGQAKQDSQQTRIADAIMSEVGCDEVGYSQCIAAAAKVMELTQDSQQEWVNGLPLFGVKCEWRIIAPDEDGEIVPTAWDYCDFIAEFDGGVIFKKAGSLYEFKKEIIDFRPIQPGQKPDEREIFAKEFSQSMSDAGSILSDFEDNFDFGRTLYDWLKSTGRLTQGGGDE